MFQFNFLCYQLIHLIGSIGTPALSVNCFTYYNNLHFRYYAQDPVDNFVSASHYLSCVFLYCVNNIAHGY